MLKDSPARAAIAVSDIERARTYYGETLGLAFVEEDPQGLTYQAGGGTLIAVYPSQAAGTAQGTVAIFDVSDLDTTMNDLRSRGVTFEDYDMPGFKTEHGVVTMGDHRGAWFKDPDNNTFGLAERAGV